MTVGPRLSTVHTVQENSICTLNGPHFLDLTVAVTVLAALRLLLRLLGSLTGAQGSRGIGRQTLSVPAGKKENREDFGETSRSMA